jgi:hypothetical protein
VSISSFTQPAHGTLTRDAVGGLTYRPRADFTGTDSFTYKPTDQYHALSNSATVTLSITHTHRGPKV